MSSIYITGIGFSGTTFLLQLFRELGFSVGGPLRGTERKGMEWTPFVDMATQLGYLAGRFPEPHAPTWTDLDYENARTVVRGSSSLRLPPDPPSVIKCPEYGQALILDRLPDIKPPVLVAHRDLTEATQAWRREHPLTRYMTDSQIYNALATMFGHLIDRLETYGIDYRILMFPRMVEDAIYAFDRVVKHLGRMGMTQFEQVHRRVADPSLVHGPSTSEGLQRKTTEGGDG